MKNLKIRATRLVNKSWQINQS